MALLYHPNIKIMAANYLHEILSNNYTQNCAVTLYSGAQPAPSTVVSSWTSYNINSSSLLWTATGVSYEWDFTGDGTVDSTDVSPSYTYNDIGNYSVSLTIVNTGGRITTTATNYIIAYTLPPGSFTGPTAQTIPYVMRDEPGVTTFIGLQSTIVPYVISDSTDSNTFIGMTTPTVPYTMSNTSDSDTFIGFENTVPYVMQDYTN